jgi:putative membrane-bound dehydrogenase-like protein
MLRVLLVLGLVPAVASGQGLSPAEAVNRMKLPDGFSVTCIAHEPMIRQPLSLSYDDRGRLWVLQYLQYPNPAGLKPVRQDQYLRTVWDRVPEPPPVGPKGADRITILSDPDERGVYRKSKDFLTGLNLASGFCLGHGGVYVVQPPYLLFYPDRNGDDVPDTDTPDVLLTGFGMEDSHSYANSLQWGPDGWLYGAHGSTVSASIRNPAYPNEQPVEFQQGIWRFHPRAKRFELFAEGGGNTFGLDFDKFGRCIAGTNYGGFAMLHHMQGAYYVKGFSKHGPLHNAHTYGYFDHVPYKGFQGGHVTCGGIVYQGDSFPTEYQDQYIAGNLLANDVYWHRLTPKASSFTASHGGTLIQSNDPWCRPVDLILSPDGSVLVADWYDKRAAHLDPIDNWDKTNGRVYRIQFKDAKPITPFDLRKKSSAELCELLNHPNAWWRRETRRLLAERRDHSLIPLLEKNLRSGEGLVPLESLWALAGMEALTPELLTKQLEHRDEHVRSWAVRLLCDQPEQIDSRTMTALRNLADSEQSPTVCSQLACSAKRLPPEDAVAFVIRLQKAAKDDAAMPLLLWWALEASITKDPKPAAEYAGQIPALSTPIRLKLVENVTRRLLAEDIKDGKNLVLKVLQDWNSIRQPDAVLRGMAAAWDGSRVTLDEGLRNNLAQLRTERPKDDLLLTLLVRTGEPNATEELRKRIADPKRPAVDRASSLDLLRQVRDPQLKALARQLFNEPTDAIRLAAITSLQSFDEPELAAILLNSYRIASPAVKRRIVQALASRPKWGIALLNEVKTKSIPAVDVPPETARNLLAFNDAELTRLVESQFGKIGPATPGEKQARISWLTIQIGRLKGDAKAGKPLFTQHCANCHTLFGEGNKVGPDLTAADRNNLPFLISQIVDPSAVVRPEYIQHRAITADGRTINGLVVEPNERTITMLDAQNQKTVLARSDIDELKPLATSLMPDKLLDTLSDQQVADLFAYLRQPAPPEKRP